MFLATVTAGRSGHGTRSQSQAADWCEAAALGPASRHAAIKRCSGVMGTPASRITRLPARSHSPRATLVRSAQSVIPSSRSSDLLTTPAFHSGGSWQLDHPELAMVGWCLLLLAVCVPLALRRFNRIVAG